MAVQNTLTMVALPVAALAVLAAGVTNAQESTIGPGLDSISTSSQFGYPEVNLSDDPQTANEQLRGLVAFNMLSAQNCIYASNVYHREGQLTDEGEEFYEGNSIYTQPLSLVEHRNNDGNFKSASQLGESEFTYFKGRTDVLRSALGLEGFDGSCLGGKELSITAALVEQNQILSAASSALDTANSWAPWNWGPTPDSQVLQSSSLQGEYGRIEFESGSTVLIDNPRMMALKLNKTITDSGAAQEDAPDFLRGHRASVFVPEGYLRGDSIQNWNTNNPGEIVSSAAVGVGTVTGGAVGTGAGVLTGAAAATIVATGPVGVVAVVGGAVVLGAVGGGYVGMEASTTVTEHFEVGSHPGILIGMDQEYQRGSDQFFEGKGMYPYRDEDGADWRDDLNAFRVRMINVPTVMGPEFSIEKARKGNEASLQLGYNYITSSANYVICDGAQGFVQSNAGDLDYDGKSDYRDDGPIMRDVVFPRIEMVEFASSCLAPATWRGVSGQSDYPAMGKFRSHTEFLDSEGNFDGPITSVPKVHPREPLSRMRGEDQEDQFERETVENSLVLTPGKKVDLTQGLARAYPNNDDGMDYQWWDRDTDIFYPTYRPSQEQCEQYRGEHEITRMFTSNTDATMLYGEEDIDDQSFSIIEKNDGYSVEMYSDTVSATYPLSYYIDRFNAEEIEVTFDIELGNLDSGEISQFVDTAQQNQMEIIKIYMDDPDSSNSDYIFMGLKGRRAALGSWGRISGNAKTLPDVYSEDRDDIKQVGRMFNILADRSSENIEDEEDIARIWERDYRLTVDKSNNEVILQAEVQTDQGEEWVVLLGREMSGDAISASDVQRLEFENRLPTGRGYPETVTTLKDVNVTGTIKGC